MNRTRTLLVAGVFTLLPIGRSDGNLDFHDDYYLGFSQGVYYGLMLAGEGYDSAWCVKGELDHAGRALGAGGEFQQKLDAVLASCREETAAAGSL